ncbi:hypothetical protein CC85DRAFT_328639 [Cutaneotrichosporon oleaginosum]|uniref:Uncharacterized protein n=1 Tax=Cutaneotrichosporon oleaginosum TaxID=879819 RepID=A0A0J0XLF9_9TREE|nr:uncharacterized protein CC85DRAFT_328639 [Cutaneotrichosporon oleaginosum]KLT41928.1 hypothetical protein CC85DRAFT_328639 [Cutaneotrichosporon oleaginosum]TXT12528.1 hypothetical protein COLE_02938 [Cutaneotrichosporon oleaginosum]
MASNNRKGRNSTPKKAKSDTQSPSATAAPKPALSASADEWPQWMKVFMTCMQMVTLASAAGLTTFGVAYVIRSWGDRFLEYDARVSFAYGWSICKAAMMYLTTLSSGWITLYVVADVFAKAAKQDPVHIKFTEAMKYLLPYAMGGMWIGHLMRFFISMPDLTFVLIRGWLITVVATNGPAMALYVRVRMIVERAEQARKARAERLRAKEEAAKAS